MRNDSTTGVTEPRRAGDGLVPRVSPLIAQGALLRDRSLQVTPDGEVRWVEAGVRRLRGGTQSEQRKAS